MKTSSAKTGPPAKDKSLLDVHHRIFFGCTVAVLVFFGSHGWAPLPIQLLLAWDGFALASIVMSWVVICTQDPYDVRRNARLQDSSATFLFTLVITAATASLLAVGLILGSAKGLTSTQLGWHVALSVSAVVFSWILVHTLFTLRYAHLYFWDARKIEREAITGGLIFPGNDSPDYLDFAYFSFVIGMTCQVSDVQIGCSRLRRPALVHGLISFAFNTAILAMFVNIIASLVGS
jgi:uncharacterized membrane protein